MAKWTRWRSRGASISIDSKKSHRPASSSKQHTGDFWETLLTQSQQQQPHPMLCCSFPWYYYSTAYAAKAASGPQLLIFLYDFLSGTIKVMSQTRELDYTTTYSYIERVCVTMLRCVCCPSLRLSFIFSPIESDVFSPSTFHPMPLHPPPWPISLISSDGQSKGWAAWKRGSDRPSAFHLFEITACLYAQFVCHLLCLFLLFPSFFFLPPTP